MTKKSSFLNLLNKAIKPSPKAPKTQAPQNSASYTGKQTRQDKTGGAASKRNDTSRGQSA